jgi:uroporphyrinogen decarboxylase
LTLLFLGNDFGSQSGALISVGALCRFIFPHLEHLARLGHDHGVKVTMHCCGAFASLIPTTIEEGIDGLQALQPYGPGMEPERLKSDFGWELVFVGYIDPHRVLIEGTPDSALAKTREIHAIMKPGGEYVVSTSHDALLEETPIANVLGRSDVARESSTGLVRG